jgi:lipopolysaccharide biosynthesis glycosyltransferase
LKENNVKYAIVTEGSDFNFPNVRVMLNSLLKHDSWVKDNIIIFTCKLTPLSNHNREIIKTINSNIKFIDIPTSMFNSIESKTRYKNEVLLSLYRLNCFNLKNIDVALYINSYSICVSTIMKLFKGESDINLANLGDSFKKNDKIIFNNKLSTSVMLISSKSMVPNMFNKCLDNFSKNKKINVDSVDDIVESSLKSESIDYKLYELDIVTKKSNFPDSKFSNYRSIQRKVCVLNMDIRLSKIKNASFMFKKINGIWNSYNSTDDWNSKILDRIDLMNSYNTPKLSDIEKIVSFLKSKTSEYNSGTYKTGVVIGLDNNYVKSNYVTLKSFYMKHSYPLTVIDCGLSKDNLDIVSTFANNVISIKDIIPNELYEKIKNRSIKHLNVSVLSSIFSYESGYENVIFMDLDLLFLKDISNLINSFMKDDTIDIMASLGGAVKKYKTGKDHTLRNEIHDNGIHKIKKLFNDIDLNKKAINTGLLLIRSNSMIKNKNNILSLLDHSEYFKYYDQTLINILINIGSLKCKTFDFTYNSVLGGLLLKPFSANDKFSLSNMNGEISFKYIHKNKKPLDIKVIHFSGPRKPWNSFSKSKKLLGIELWKIFTKIKTN